MIVDDNAADSVGNQDMATLFGEIDGVSGGDDGDGGGDIGDDEGESEHSDTRMRDHVDRVPVVVLDAALVVDDLDPLTDGMHFCCCYLTLTLAVDNFDSLPG